MCVGVIERGAALLAAMASLVEMDMMLIVSERVMQPSHRTTTTN